MSLLDQISNALSEGETNMGFAYSDARTIHLPIGDQKILLCDLKAKGTPVPKLDAIPMTLFGIDIVWNLFPNDSTHHLRFIEYMTGDRFIFSVAPHTIAGDTTIPLSPSVSVRRMQPWLAVTSRTETNRHD